MLSEREEGSADEGKGWSLVGVKEENGKGELESMVGENLIQRKERSTEERKEQGYSAQLPQAVPAADGRQAAEAVDLETRPNE